MEWKKPASMETTIDAWLRFRHILEVGGGLAMLQRFTGITDDSLKWMAENRPFMPWSEDLCKFIFNMDIDNIVHGQKRVGTVKLAERLRNLHDYGYSYSEIAKGHDFSAGTLQRIAAYDYPYTSQETFNKIMKVVRTYESMQRRELREYINSGAKWRAY